MNEQQHNHSLERTSPYASGAGLNVFHRLSDMPSPVNAYIHEQMWPVKDS